MGDPVKRRATDEDLLAAAILHCRRVFSRGRHRATPVDPFDFGYLESSARSSARISP